MLSKYVTAPIVLILIIVVMTTAFVRKEHVPDSIILGFAIATSFGGLMRMFPRYHEKLNDPNY